METILKKLRLFLATSAVASAFVVGGAAPAQAKCVGDPVNPCVLLCSVGYNNKYTHPLFKWCEVV